MTKTKMTNFKKKKKTKGRKLSQKELLESVSNLFKFQPRKKFTPSIVIQKLKIKNSIQDVEATLKSLNERKFIKLLSSGKYTINRKDSSGGRNNGNKSYQGKVDLTRSGAAYIVCDDFENDIYVSSRNRNSALDGDIVKVQVSAKGGRHKLEGRIVEIVERKTETFVGTFRDSGDYGFVVTEDSQMAEDIYIKPKDYKNAKTGQKVVVRVVDWPRKHGRSPIGKIINILGDADTSDVEMKSILISQGFSLEFPEEVIRESETLSTEITQSEIDKRRDMRQVTTFTIDPDTAKDFDDALSLQKLENGNWEIGVHIADVSHYVVAGSDLDKEAADRTTSVYLVDRVLPMLPEKLSNELCSLRPNEDKLTFSAVFEFDKNDKVVNRWFGKTVIHSDYRFAYEGAQAVMDEKEGPYLKELNTLNRIAKVLRKQKFENGAIAFESEEVKFRLDENGKPLEVYVKERKDAHLLIEDFMLLANREVATYMVNKNTATGQEIPFVYRVHDLPDPDRVADFSRFANELGLKIKTDTPKQIAESYNVLVKEAKKNPIYKILEPLAIRTMAKAIYTTDNIGHYGLGFDNYTHFTSPIRRYADVLVHRILFENLKKDYRVKKSDLEASCKHISEQERNAMKAERESIKYKQVEYIKGFIGEAFEGTINGMIDMGMFVELTANKCEGMVTFNSLDENFKIGESRLKATSRSGKVFKLGDTVTVRILDADLDRKQINLELVE